MVVVVMVVATADYTRELSEMASMAVTTHHMHQYMSTHHTSGLGGWCGRSAAHGVAYPISSAAHEGDAFGAVAKGGVPAHNVTPCAKNLE